MIHPALIYAVALAAFCYLALTDLSAAAKVADKATVVAPALFGLYLVCWWVVPAGKSLKRRRPKSGVISRGSGDDATN